LTLSERVSVTAERIPQRDEKKLAKSCICSNQTKTNLKMAVVITLQVSLTKYQNITSIMNGQ
jgi:hypothetical protein